MLADSDSLTLALGLTERDTLTLALKLTEVLADKLNEGDPDKLADAEAEDETTCPPT